LQQKQAKPETIAALAGVRAIPPLLIILYHFGEGHHYSGLHDFDRLIARGYLWVEFFFVLSGFILTYVYGARRETLLAPGAWLRFVTRRLVRLYPLHLAMLLLIGGLVLVYRGLAAAGGYVSIFDLPYHQDISAKGLALSLLLVHAWNTMGHLTWNGVSWFVSVEFALCLLFPFLLWLLRASAARAAVFVAAGVAGLSLLSLASPHGLDITFHNGVLRGLSDFAAGMGMAVLVGKAKARDCIPAFVHSGLQALVLGLLALVIFRTGWAHTHFDIFTVLPLMLLVPLLAFDRGFLAGFFKAPPLQKLGEWSYAIYMGQTFWLLTIRYCEQRLYPPPDTLIFGFRFSSLAWGLEPALLVGVCVLWGALLARTVERPAASALRRRLDPGRAAAPSFSS
jgi:peptidoglycan/LPS O-acetylase OafA/YrhL